MRLSTRTALAAFAAAVVTLLAIGVLFRIQFEDALRQRVDQQLDQRAETAPVLAAIASRLSTSELSGTVEGTRVLDADGNLVALGLLPLDPLPPVERPGWQTVTADGQRWRLHTIEVLDVPSAGDRALVQMAAPLGDVDAAARRLRRRAGVVVLLASTLAGLIGLLLGRIAARPLARLGDDAARLDAATPQTWSVADSYGAPEVDEVAHTLNGSFVRLTNEIGRRDQALEAARAFAASASHELRTPLQSSLTNLDIAASELAPEPDRREAIATARHQLLRMGASLGAVRALADAEFADPDWFVDCDLTGIVEAVVADQRRRRPDAAIDLSSDDGATVVAWPDGVHLAVENLIRNALVHGHRGDGAGDQPHVAVTVEGARVIVDDAGPGIAAELCASVVQRFVKGSGSTGSGLGLAIAAEVARAHGGELTIGVSPLGGARIVIALAAEPVGS